VIWGLWSHIINTRLCFSFLYRIVLYGFTPYDADCVTLLCASLAAGLYAYVGYYVHGPENKNKKKKNKKKNKSIGAGNPPHHLTMKSEKKYIYKYKRKNI
jgi:hypothetical protein